ncbi:hypothetical protein BDZ89DRAFT_1070239 [Hymenopellis radicata]|nr:hypothetical protein BDZ89DRAFT_1070239 [Hymenopellis radicata]
MPTNISRAPPPAVCAEFYNPSLPDFCSTDVYKRLASTNSEPIRPMIDRRLSATQILSKVQEGVDVFATRREHLRTVIHHLEQEQS